MIYQSNQENPINKLIHTNNLIFTNFCRFQAGVPPFKLSSLLNVRHDNSLNIGVPIAVHYYNMLYI